MNKIIDFFMFDSLIDISNRLALAILLFNWFNFTVIPKIEIIDLEEILRKAGLKI